MEGGLEWWRIVILGIIIGGLGAFALWLNRNKITQQFSRSKSSLPRMMVRERYWLNAKTEILLLEVGKESFLLAHNPQHLTWQPLQSSTPELIDNEKVS